MGVNFNYVHIWTLNNSLDTRRKRTYLWEFRNRVLTYEGWTIVDSLLQCAGVDCLPGLVREQALGWVGQGTGLRSERAPGSRRSQTGAGLDQNSGQALADGQLQQGTPNKGSTKRGPRAPRKRGLHKGLHEKAEQGFIKINPLTTSRSKCSNYASSFRHQKWPFYNQGPKGIYYGP